MQQFQIQGGRPLKGEVKVSGSKNAALPILAATLLTDKKCVIHNIPDIDDVRTMLKILKHLGSQISFARNTVTIQTPRLKNIDVPSDFACRMRASVLLVGPLLARTRKASLAYPGGCVLGARPIDTHLDMLEQFGIRQVSRVPEQLSFIGKPQKEKITLSEFSVTATENALMLAAGAHRVHKKVTIQLAAAEPHVQDLCHFLSAMGVKIEGVGTHTLTVHPKKNLKGVIFRITPDYLEAGTLALAAVVTKGSIKIHDIVPEHLDSLWNLLREMGVPFELGKNTVTIRAAKNLRACKRLQTNIFPGFPTDLQAPCVIALTQAKGDSLIHETLFEGRFKYVPELTKMAANIEILNPHEVVVHGPTPLKPGTVKSWDIRAGAALLLAALAAKGKTTVTDIHYIDRGYEEFDEKLRALGARIERI